MKKVAAERYRSIDFSRASGGNYQTLINDALLAHGHRRSTLDVVRQVVREELAPYGTARRPQRRRMS